MSECLNMQYTIQKHLTNNKKKKRNEKTQTNRQHAKTRENTTKTQAGPRLASDDNGSVE